MKDLRLCKALLFSTLLLLELFVATHGSATSDGFIKIWGAVDDATSGAKLRAASVFLKGATVQNVTNSSGVFSIVIPQESYTDADTLIVSYLGYNTERVCITNFRPEQSSPYRVHLRQSPFALGAIYVRPDDPLLIFNLIFSNSTIKKNYSSQQRDEMGFYRELIKRGGRYASMTEAVLQIQKAPYNSIIARDKAYIYKGRGAVSRKISDTLIVKLKGGVLSNLYTDLAKNSFIGTTVEAAPNYYDFSFDTPIFEDDRVVYVLNFRQKESVQSFTLYDGSIYVDSETLALRRVEFSCNVDRREDSWKLFITKLQPGITIKAEGAKYIVNYRLGSDGLTYFDYSRIELSLSAKYKGRPIKSRYSIITELAITESSSDPIVAKENRLRFSDIMESKAADYNDAGFWGDYNVIEPDADIESIIRKILRQLR